MLKAPRILTSFLVLLLFTACSDKQKTSKEELLVRTWTYKEKRTDTDLNLTLYNSDGKQTFNTNIPGFISETGTWKLESDSLITFVGDPLIDSSKIDSTVIINRNGESSIRYFNKGKLLGSNQNGFIQSPKEQVTYTIADLNEDHLILEGVNLMKFYYEPDTFSSGFSISSILRGLLGIISLLLIAWLFSNNRRAIDWKLVGKGLVLQMAIALAILKVPLVGNIFDWISKGFIKIVDFTTEGTKFLFASFGSQTIEEPLLNFAIMILPTVIFFSALTSLFYYWGILQRVVWLFAVVMRRIMNLSGAESMAAAGNIFIGQTEAPLLVKPYLLGMTKSEIMCLMTGGMATIAGGVLAAYIGFLGGGDPAQELYFAKHLLTASIMSAPAAIVAAKIIIPETENYKKDLKISKDKIGTNELEAITNGTTDGIRLAVNVAGMLLVFTALVAMANWILGEIGDMTNLNKTIAENTAYNSLSFDLILGYIGAPIVWLMGVSGEDMVLVGELLGKKTVINEFIAYPRLGEMQAAGDLSAKSVMMATYMLCGFANIASIGIQIGGIGALVPSRKGLLSKLGFKALIAGTIACLMTAVMAGMLF